ncbi:hypothetical protein O6H91_10G028100 [Diphasiastrum complanatum]|uniref:Uncharacterized protein n=1 Tax=Diphasiastrum complanatum TaxID=34168 RepID=A0ACC2CFF3_DIPCM|nr:hypothetical protein O6H91_10G028100 [Diphasiastrum complanatum]
MAAEGAWLEIPVEAALQMHAHSQAVDDQNPRTAAGAVDAVEVQGVAKRKRASTARDRISKMPPCAAGKRSSIYRGVTRHRWTGRYEAHLWDKSTWNQTQNKKGKQVYLGAYDEEEAAARAYDLAALKYWGPGTLINFPVTDYTRDIEEMQTVSREEYLASLRRKSSGFSRGVSKYRGVARHHHNGRWEARIGRVFGNKYLYLGTYSTQEEAAAAYDMAAIEYRGLNAVTNFDLSRYIRWLRPGYANGSSQVHDPASPRIGEETIPSVVEEQFLTEDLTAQAWPGQRTEPYQLPALGVSPTHAQRKASSPTALSLLLQSSMFRQMLEKASTKNADPTCSDFAATAATKYNLPRNVNPEEFQQPPATTTATATYDDSEEFARKPYQTTTSPFAFSHDASHVPSLQQQEAGERARLESGLSIWKTYGAHKICLEAGTVEA